MPIPESAKFDVRIRERLQRSGELSEAEVQKHLEALPDVAGNAVDIELKQPALQTEAERAENSVVVRPAPARPVIVAPINLDEEEDDEEEEEIKPAAKKPPVEAVAALAAAADDDEEDEDDDDEDDEDEDEDEDAEAEDAVDGEEKPSGADVPKADDGDAP